MDDDAPASAGRSRVEARNIADLLGEVAFELLEIDAKRGWHERTYEAGRELVLETGDAGLRLEMLEVR